MATGGAKDIATVKSDIKSISCSVSEGNMMGQKSSPIYRGGSGGASGKKGGMKKTKDY